MAPRTANACQELQQTPRWLTIAVLRIPAALVAGHGEQHVRAQPPRKRTPIQRQQRARAAAKVAGQHCTSM
jgi:hypothetical protein